MSAVLNEYTLWTMAIGALVNVTCGILGCYLVLRRLSLLGDAISHAILPGLALAFMVSGSRALLPMFIGAMAVGMLTTFLTQFIHRIGGVKHDASMGVVFTSLFALGVVLITRVARQVDLDPGCVLYGDIETLASVLMPHAWLGGAELPYRFLPLTGVLGAVVLFVVVLWKELKIVSFDPQLATSMGISAAVVHYALMAMVAGATVAAFEAVGSVLVVAMLIVPGATAHLLTDRLWWMLVLSSVTGVVAAVAGTLLGIYFNTSIAGMMVVVMGGQFALAVLAAPHYGVLPMRIRRVLLAWRIVTEDILALLFRFGEMAAGRRLAAREIVQALGGGMAPVLALWRLRWEGLIRRDATAVELTPHGKARAVGLVRGHRLWESYLAKHFDLPVDHLHDPAERMEHYLDETMRDALVRDLGDHRHDPHGQPIP